MWFPISYCCYCYCYSMPIFTQHEHSAKKNKIKIKWTLFFCFSFFLFYFRLFFFYFLHATPPPPGIHIPLEPSIFDFPAAVACIASVPPSPFLSLSCIFSGSPKWWHKKKFNKMAGVQFRFQVMSLLLHKFISLYKGLGYYLLTSKKAKSLRWFLF